MSECSRGGGRMPTLFVCHGGGPFPLLDPPRGGAALTEHLRSISQELPETPKAILVISAHWEEGDEVAVSASAQPPMLFDYYGFPPHTYSFRYDAPGDPALASRVCSLLATKGHPCRQDASRGFDHGVFVPLLLAYPAADIPVVCLSLHASLDPALHLRIGAARAPLRGEGVLMIGSGNSFHNMREKDAIRAGKFNAALTEAVCAPQAVRDKALSDWARLDEARFAHPREEHLLPLFVVAGAAGGDTGRCFYTDGERSSFRFG